MYHSSTVYKNMLYIFGGRTDGNVKSTVLRLDLGTTFGNLLMLAVNFDLQVVSTSKFGPGTRYKHLGFMVDGKLGIYGGRSSRWIYSDCHLLDLASIASNWYLTISAHNSKFGTDMLSAHIGGDFADFSFHVGNT